jgi:hypothetical protein
MAPPTSIIYTYAWDMLMAPSTSILYTVARFDPTALKNWGTTLAFALSAAAAAA